MKRFIPWKKLVGFNEKIGMREHENGDYVRYEDVKKMLIEVIKSVGITVDSDILAKEMLEKEWE